MLFAESVLAAEPIEEIQVTASRQPLSVYDAPSAISVVKGDSLLSETLATDSLAFQPGTYLQQTTPGQGSVIVRGLKGSAVLHLVDGTRLNNAIFRNAPTQYLALVSPASIERIEVLRGSATTLYGNDAMGGVVNVLSRMPHFDDSSRSVRGDVLVGADTAELSRFVRGTVEAGNRNLAALASFDFLELGDRRTGDGNRIAPGGFRSHSARFAVLKKTDESKSWLLDFQYLEQPDTPRVDELVAGFGQDDPSSSEFSFAPNVRSFLHVRHDRDIGVVNWNFDASWQRIDDDRITRGFGSNERRRENNRSDLVGIAANGSRTSNTTNWSFGGEYYQDRVRSDRIGEDIVTGVAQRLAPRFPDDSRVDQGALYAHAVHQLSERQSLQGGLRYSHYDIDLAPSQSLPGSSIKLDEISGDAGWLYHLTDTLRFTVNVGRGVRAPNIFDLGTLGERPGNRFNVANSTLGAERVQQFDIGIKGGTDKWRFETSVFRLNYNNRITSVLTGATTPDGRDVVQSQNISEASIWGVELGGQVNLFDQSGITLAINYTRGEETQSGSPTTAADRIPPLNGRLRFYHQSNEKLLLETYLEFAAEQNRLSSRDQRDSRIDPSGTPGWATANIRATFNPTDSWQLRLSFENAFDKRYRVHGSGIDAPGRNLALSVRRLW